MPRRKTFGPFSQTPEITIKRLEEGIDVSPSIIDAIPFGDQFDYEEIRGGVIKKKMREHEREIERKRDILWREYG